MTVTPGKLPAISTQPPVPDVLRAALRQMARDRSIITCSLLGLAEVVEVGPGRRGRERCLADLGEGRPVGVYLAGLGYLLDLGVVLQVHDAGIFVVGEIEDVDHAAHARVRAVGE